MPRKMTTLRRLSNDDVKNVFDCIYNNMKPLDEKLMFKIIVVGPTGMKLSPPSYEFEGKIFTQIYEHESKQKKRLT